MVIMTLYLLAVAAVVAREGVRYVENDPRRPDSSHSNSYLPEA